jgi:hypothetical protein
VHRAIEMETILEEAFYRDPSPAARDLSAGVGG